MITLLLLMDIRLEVGLVQVSGSFGTPQRSLQFEQESFILSPFFLALNFLERSERNSHQVLLGDGESAMMPELQFSSKDG